MLKEKNRAGETLASEQYLQYTLYKDVLARKRLTAVVERVSSYAKEVQKNRLKILDLGCGIGGMAFPLSYLGHTVVGVDVDSQSIEDCNSKNTFPNATYLVGDIANLDLLEPFDVVICSEVLEHSLEPNLILQTIKRHLTPDGIAIVTIPNGYCLYELVFSRLFQKLKITTLFHRLPPKMYRALTGSPSPYHSLNIFCGHVQFFTLRRFTRLIGECGFRLMEIVNLSLGLFLDWKWLSPLRRLECNLAGFVPNAVAGGWVFVAKLKGISDA
ncbi:class I SAM-dependent methyltransferase [Chloroflexota bacterium]